MRADLHPQNIERLKSLDAYQILDTERDQDLSDIVDLAAEICALPVAVISLVDRDRQWFKADVGLEVSQTPIEQSICAHAILQDGLLEIPDTWADPRTVDNPLCNGAHPFRFYAGQPLVAENGLPLGTLCVLDHTPRTLTPLQRKTLALLARQVMKQFDLRIALRDQSILQAEADHRVKNSLQSMSSIARIYARTVEDQTAKSALEAIQRKIDAVAELHLELQSTDGRNTIDAATYLTRVISLLKVSAPRNVSFETALGDIVMRSDQATHLAVIISEFASNAIKHAFPDNRAGKITIDLTVTEPGSYRLECRDNGVGTQAAPSARSATSGIGMRLVQAAASSLGGHSQTDMSDAGTTLTLDFRDGPVADNTLVAQA